MPEELSQEPVPATNALSHDSAFAGKDVEGIQELRVLYEQLRQEIGRVIIGQDAVIERLLICILSRGHGLLMGVPGLAKTLMVQSLAQAMSLAFSRIQFTPDLMPSDITGTDILQETDQPGRRAFEFVKGPIFANIVLADEINRTPPKTQSALLEAMQENQVTASGHDFDLPNPFFVLATQNPIEQEGTYALPEAQLDRFMFLIHVTYPSREEERRIARETTGAPAGALRPLVTGEQVLRFQDLVSRIPVPDHIYDTVVDLVRMSRPRSGDAPDWVRRCVTWGAGPRAVQYLIRGAKARAALHGSYLVRMEDVEEVSQPVLLHRIITNFQAQSEGITPESVVARLWESLRDEVSDE